MFRFFFSLIPWWMFAIVALTFAPITVEMYETYRGDSDQAQTALAVGPPPEVTTQAFNPRRSPWPFGEVRLNGTLRADVGILTAFFGETEYRYVIIDNDGSGTMVAILSTAAASERTITQLVEAADNSGRVTVQGFLAPSRVGDISRTLAQRGYTTGQVYVIEPYFGSREAVISTKVEDSQLEFFIALGFTSVLALTAVWRFRRWRKRRAQKRTVRAARAQTPVQQPQSQSKQPTQKALPSGNAASPWDTFSPQDSNIAPQSSARTVKPQTQKMAPGQPLPKPQSNRTPKPVTTDAPPAEPEFKSVFPGGGSAFRFKTADEIIRQSFGTLSSLNKVNRDDP